MPNRRDDELRTERGTRSPQGAPSGQGRPRPDDVGGSGVYPASGPPPPGDAVVRGQAEWGQGIRGAAGYEDHGESEALELPPESEASRREPGPSAGKGAGSRGGVESMNAEGHMESMTGRERYRTNKQDLGWSEEQADQNVGETERVVSGVLGAGLLTAGVFRRSWAGGLLAVVGAALLHRGVSGYCMLYDAIGADTNALGRRKVRTGQSVKVQKRIRIDRPREELYRFWRNLENLPRIMSHLDSVQVLNDRLSHWVIKALPIGGPKLEWDAEIINEIEHELIGWRSLRGSDVDNAGSVRFEPAGDGRSTDVTVTMQYAPPGGRLGSMIASIMGQDPERLLEEDLRRFKDLIETQGYSLERERNVAPAARL
ncbi:SRPBCC family protein [Candidatus Nitrospira bockiana]